MDRFYRYLLNYYPQVIVQFIFLIIGFTSLFTLLIVLFLLYDLNITTINHKIEYIRHSYFIYLIAIIFYLRRILIRFKKFGLSRYSKLYMEKLFLALMISVVFYLPFIVIESIIIKKFEAHYLLLDSQALSSFGYNLELEKYYRDDGIGNNIISKESTSCSLDDNLSTKSILLQAKEKHDYNISDKELKEYLITLEEIFNKNSVNHHFYQLKNAKNNLLFIKNTLPIIVIIFFSTLILFYGIEFFLYMFMPVGVFLVYLYILIGIDWLVELLLIKSFLNEKNFEIFLYVGGLIIIIYFILYCKRELHELYYPKE